MKYCPVCNKTYPGDYNVCPADQTGLQNTHEFQPGMIIRNKYQILDRIGVGGMGVVYRARHVTFNEMCAIKIVSDAIAGDANFLQRFQTEAVVTRKLRHPNAVRVDDFDYTEDGRPFIVMELVEGKNIGEILHAEGPFRVPRALRIATQTARALGVAHKLGVVHRDIKPANILLATDEQGQEIAKVLDFGIAKLREVAGDAQPGMTMTGMVVGTPLYMSPEQFMGKKAAGEIDGRTDIYSLGVVLYQMVTAQLPFEGDTPYSLMMQHMQGTVRPPHELAPDLHIPESLSRVILKAIDKSRDLRFQTAEEFIAALDEVAADPVTGDQAVNTPAVNTPAADALAANDLTPSVPVTSGTLPNLTAPPSIPVPQPPAAPMPASQVRATQTPGAQNRASQVSPTLPMSQPSVAVNASTLMPPTSAPVTPPLAPTLPLTASALAVPSIATIASPTPADSAVANSAAQHVFVPPRKFQLAQVIALVVLLLAAVLVAGVGYVKYQAYRRIKIENAITARFNAVPSLHQAELRVFVSDTREVTLDGKVSSKDDFVAAGDLAASVHGVTSVVNRVEYPPSTPAVVPPVVSPGVVPPVAPTDTPESMVSEGTKFMDDGKYADAIASFSKAAEADPNNQATKELLARARKAQQTEEQLLRNRRLP
jgi:serine/threonine protein kinase